MSNEQINIPSLVVILVLSGLIVRYFFFSPPSPQQQQQQQQQQRDQQSRQSLAAQRARELAVERIQQMFPQVDRRAALWELQRNGGSVQVATERILAGRLETPPITFQPPPLSPPSPPNQPASSSGGTAASQGNKSASQPAQLDLITRYNLKEQVSTTGASEAEAQPSGNGTKADGKAWSSSRDERQNLLQKRRDQMILEARRKMEAKIAAEKAAASTAGTRE